MCPPPLLLPNYSFPRVDQHLISMASTCCQSIITALPTHPSSRSRGFTPYNVSIFGCAARFDLSTLLMNGCRFQALGGWRKLKFRRRRSALRETDPSLTGDDDDDGEGAGGDFTEVNSLVTARTTRHLVRLIPPSLIDRIRVASYLYVLGLFSADTVSSMAHA